MCGLRFPQQAVLLIGCWLPLVAAAGMFDDTEARKAIVDVRSELLERIEKLEVAVRAQAGFANEIETLRGEVAKLRGQNEVLTYELESANKRLRDFYVDLDTRVRKQETVIPADLVPPTGADTATAAGAPAPDPAAAPRKPADPVAEARAYEAALTLFKQAKYADALAALVAFRTDYPDSALAPSAQYWLGNTHYALRDCRKAIAAQAVVTEKFGNSSKAADALLATATCQAELGDAKAARATLETLASRHPDTPAGETAKVRLKKK
jgi:tol-pal system protein YbgF